MKYLDKYAEARIAVADYYDSRLNSIPEIDIPFRAENSTHVFHQYTLKVKNGQRDELKKHLKLNGIPSMIYYPIPLYKQKAFSSNENLEVTEQLCKQVISIPIHTEMDEKQLSFIADTIESFFG